MIPRTGRIRSIIWTKTLIVAAAFGLSVWWVDVLILARLEGSRPLLLALAFSLVQVLAIFLMLVKILSSKLVHQLRQRRAQRVGPTIRARLAAHALGSDDLAELKKLHGSFPDEVERCFVDFLGSVAGTALRRFSELAVALGLAARWEMRYGSRQPQKRREAITCLGQLSWEVARKTVLAALQDQDQDVRMEALRALVQCGESETIEKAFAMALTQPLLARALLVESLGPHALTLSRGAIPEALNSPDCETVLAALEILQGWRKALVLPGFPRLFRHARPEVRARALRLLPYLAGVSDAASHILAALQDGDSRVRSGAAIAAGRLKLKAALPLLSHALHEPDADTSKAAAYALAAMGPSGLEILETAIRSPRQPAASAAVEALERARTDRLEYANL